LRGTVRIRKFWGAIHTLVADEISAESTAAAGPAFEIGGGRDAKHVVRLERIGVELLRTIDVVPWMDVLHGAGLLVYVLESGR